MRNLDLFSGIGGFTYAAERLVGGITTTQFVETDKYCQKILKKHWPDKPIHDDIRTFKAERGQFDLFTIGFPCQDLSVAGNKQGIGEGTRSGLFYESIRLLREVRPRFALFENVRNLLSHEGGETFQEILFQIAKSGYSCEWAVISAKDLGACHLRERIWIVAYTNSERLQRGERNSQGEGRKILSSEQHDRSEIRSETGCTDGIQSEKRDATSRISPSSDTDSKRLQRLRREYELQESSKERQIIWRSQPHTLNPNWKGYISKPTLCRGDDGLSNRVARLKALGNSIVPACAAVPLQRIKDLNEHYFTPA